MYADRHDRSSGIDPRSLGIAVAINATLIAALMASHVDLGVRDPEHHLVGYNIPLPKPEVPPPPKPIERQRPSTQTVSATKPVVELPRPDDTVITTINLTPPLPLPLAPSTGTASTPAVAPAPALVTIPAEIDEGHRGDLQPAYPPSELRAEREGIVTVRVLIGVDGRVHQVQQVAATSDAFFRATEGQALRRWRFHPSTRGGVPIEAWRTMTIRFVIPN